VKITLHRIRCLAKTESDADEIYCVVSTGAGQNRRQLARTEVGKFQVGTNIHPDRLLLPESNSPEVTITFMESDVNEPGRGSDDFIGEIVVSADGNCSAGRSTLDEGYDESHRYRQFSMTGSAAHYVIQLQIQ
jgi:hypothetical protein